MPRYYIIIIIMCIYYEITLLLLIIIIVFYYYYYLLCSFFFFTISLLVEKVAVGATIFHYAQCYRSLSLLSPSMVSCNGRSQQAGIRQSHIPLRRSTSKQTQRKKAISSIVCLIRLAFIVGFKAIVRILG